MRIDDANFETIASLSGFYKYIDGNKEQLGFDKHEFHNNCVEDMFEDGNPSDRYSKDWCNQVINKEEHTLDECYDKSRPYYTAILMFMEDYNFEKIRFDHDL